MMGVVGLFINVLPLRLDLCRQGSWDDQVHDGGPSFVDTSVNIQTLLVGALEHAELRGDHARRS